MLRIQEESQYHVSAFTRQNYDMQYLQYFHEDHRWRVPLRAPTPSELYVATQLPDTKWHERESRRTLIRFTNTFILWPVTTMLVYTSPHSGQEVLLYSVLYRHAYSVAHANCAWNAELVHGSQGVFDTWNDLIFCSDWTLSADRVFS